MLPAKQRLTLDTALKIPTFSIPQNLKVCFWRNTAIRRTDILTDRWTDGKISAGQQLVGQWPEPPYLSQSSSRGRWCGARHGSTLWLHVTAEALPSWMHNLPIPHNMKPFNRPHPASEWSQPAKTNETYEWTEVPEKTERETEKYAAECEVSIRKRGKKKKSETGNNSMSLCSLWIFFGTIRGT